MAATTLSRPFYGVLLAPTLVLAVYGGTHVSPDHLYRPLGVAALVTAVLFGLIGRATRGRWHAASLIVTLSLLATLDRPTRCSETDSSDNCAT